MTPWQALPDGVGTVVAVTGEIRVAAQAGRLRAWRGLDPTLAGGGGGAESGSSDDPGRPCAVGPLLRRSRVREL